MQNYSNKHPYEVCREEMLTGLQFAFDIFKTKEADSSYRSGVIYNQMCRILAVSPNSNPQQTDLTKDPVIVLRQLEGWLDPRGREDGFLFSSDHPIIAQLQRFKENFYKQYVSVEKVQEQKNDFFWSKSLPESTAQAENNQDDSLGSKMLEMQRQNEARFKLIETKTKTLEEENKKISEANRVLDEKANICSDFLMLLYKENQQAYKAIYNIMPKDKNLEYLPKVLTIEEVSLEQKQIQSSAIIPQGMFYIKIDSKDENGLAFQATVLPYIKADGKPFKDDLFHKRHALILQFKQIYDENSESADVMTQAKLSIRCLLLTKYHHFISPQNKQSMSIQEVKKYMPHILNSDLQQKIAETFGTMDDSQELGEIPESYRRTQYSQEEAVRLSSAYSTYLPKDEQGKAIFSNLWKHLQAPNQVKLMFQPENYFSDCVTATYKCK